MEYRRGHVYRVNLEPALGHEQQGLARPVVILSRDELNARRGTVVAVPLSNRGRPAPPLVVAVPSAGESSVALCEQIRALDKRRFVREMGQLSEDDLRQVEVGVGAVLLL
jgi:mRNA interferase MazF